MQVEDPRTSDPNVYSPDCMPSGTAVYGVGAQVDANNKVIQKGILNGSVVVEFNGGVTHMTNSLLFSILATEVVSESMAIVMRCVR